jgi:hypothetical protein
VAAVYAVKDAEGVFATWLGVMVSSRWTTSVGWPHKRVSQDVKPFDAAGTKTDNQPQQNSNLQEEFFTTRVMVFLLLLSIMSEIYNTISTRRKFTTERILR